MKLQEKFKKKYKVDAIDFVEKANLKFFGMAKSLGLEKVLKQYAEQENISIDINDEFRKDLVEAFAEAGEKFPENQKIDFDIVDKINLEPTPINPPVPKNKGTLENFKDIVSKDDFRPQMTAVYVSEDGDYLASSDSPSDKEAAKKIESKIVFSGALSLQQAEDQYRDIIGQISRVI